MNWAIALLIMLGFTLFNPTYEGDRTYEGALELAARAGQIEVVKLLVDRGVPLPETLHGVMGGARVDTSVSMTDFFLQVGVDINAPDDNGNTPLHEAVRRQNLHATQFLIDRGARINEHNHEGKTPLDIAVSKGYSDIEAVLIAEGAVRGRVQTIRIR